MKANKLVFAILVIIVFMSFKKSKIAQLCKEFFSLKTQGGVGGYVIGPPNIILKKCVDIIQKNVPYL